MLLLIDNYDSFVYNLARYFTELGCETKVLRNDAIDVESLRALQPQGIIISPGPCTPNEAGVSIEVIRELSDSIPILGVCLGHQAIAVACGGHVVRAQEPVHGKSSLIEHSGTGLFKGIPSPLRVGRYHSLIVDERTLPNELSITARTVEGIPMALQHRSRLLFGVQFHPESVLTEHGRPILANFLRLIGIVSKECQDNDWHAQQDQVDHCPQPVLTW